MLNQRKNKSTYKKAHGFFPCALVLNIIRRSASVFNALSALNISNTSNAAALKAST